MLIYVKSPCVIIVLARIPGKDLNMLKNIYDFRTWKIHQAPELNVERYECKPVAINRAKEDAMNMHF